MMAKIRIQRKFIAIIEEEEEDKDEEKRTQNAKVSLAKGYLFVFYRLALMLSRSAHPQIHTSHMIPFAASFFSSFSIHMISYLVAESISMYYFELCQDI